MNNALIRLLTIRVVSRAKICVEMADQEPQKTKKRVFRQFYYRGVILEKLLAMDHKQFAKIAHSRATRKIMRNMDDKYKHLLVKLRKAKKAAQPGEKPPIVKTHLRSMLIFPEMVGNIIGIYNGKEFVQVEIKPEMIGFYLGEFGLCIRPVQHGKPGVGATHSSRFIPLK